MDDKELKQFKRKQIFMENYIRKLDDEELTYLINHAVREMDERLEDFNRYKTKKVIWKKTVSI